MNTFVLIAESHGIREGRFFVECGWNACHAVADKHGMV